ncbi:MAG TPA: Amuc_1100 family pilus-like protein [Lacunisphaera sp.]|jgi:hypothetical protein|nr:Amuc_1100 family pilus-like protein [Lacunisphaera sp.]
MKLHQSIIAAVLGALLASAGLEAWIWCHAGRAARRALAKLDATRAERDRLGRQSPAPTAEYEEAVHDRIEAVRGMLAGLRAELAATDQVTPASVPAKPVDAYFEIAAFVERTRTEAAEAGVTARAGERFGFAAHASAGPRPELVEAVGRQRAEIEQLIETLLASQPRALLAVQRERPLTDAERSQRKQPDGPAAAQSSIARGREDETAVADFFDFDPVQSIRRRGLIDTDAFRLEFTGPTTSLRSFLNRLATSRWPVVVRNVEVEPVSSENRSSSRPEVASSGPVPLVTGILSRFTVVVEVLVIPRREAAAES